MLLAAVVLATGLVSWGLPQAEAAKTMCGILPGHICATLTITLTGNGTGRFQTTNTSSTPDGSIDCRRGGGFTSGTCAYTWDVVSGNYAVVYWLQTSAAGSDVCSGACLPGTSQLIGDVHVFGSTTDTLHGFALISPVTVTVARTGSGSGSVKSGPAGISCGSSCQGVFASGQPMTLTATAAKGSVFAGWSNGPCSGKASTCSFAPTGVTVMVATFNAAGAPAHTGSPTPAPTPSSSASAEVVAAASAESTASVVAAAPTDSGSGAAAVPSSPSPDLTPIAIAIVIAALVIAAALVLAIGILPRRMKPRA